MTSGTTMLLQFCALGVTMSWDEGLLGARAFRPHQAWHSLGHLPHLDQPGTAPWLSFGLADAVPADRVAACSIALMRAGAPRGCGGQRRPKGEDAGVTPALPDDAFLRKPTCTLWETPVCRRAGPPPCRADHSRKNGRSLMKMNHEWTPINTNRSEDRWTSLNHKRHQNASAIWCPWGDDVMG